MIKKILIFFVDVLNQRKSLFYINTDSSYQIFRILNRISNGLLTKLLEIFITKKNNKNFQAGYKKLKDISHEETENILKELDKMRVYNKTKIKKIHYSNLKLDVEKFSYKINSQDHNEAVRLDILKYDLLSNLKIAEFASQKKWLNIIEENFQFSPQLMDITAWYTFPEVNTKLKSEEEETSYDAQIWHRDVDKLRDIKIFTYLTDVNDLDDGPFEILKETHTFSFDKFKFSNKNNYRILNKDIPKKYQNKKISFTGNKGTNFIVDTRCLHRGVKVKKNYRLILELYFSNSFFGKHFKFNDFTRPKLNMDWDSYKFWKQKIEKEPQIYKYLFLGRD
tara:strand:+ start:519 stop:1526 length:1008 start_codon:yes stop_codon:yes gene_type:complete